MAKKDTATLSSPVQDQPVTSPATDASSEALSQVPETKTERRQHEVNNSGFYMYIGPTIRGVIQNGKMYRGTRAEAMEKAASAIEKYKLVKSLIVSGDALPVARMRLKEPGNAFYVNYRKLSKQVLEARQDAARKNATPEEAAKLAAAEAEKKEG